MTDDLTTHAATIVAAYVAHNALPPDQVPALLATTYATLTKLGYAQLHVEPEPELVLVPAVPIKKSVTPDYVVCLEDGKKFRSMKRHLTGLGMTPESYRKKWGLDESHPIVAPNYAAVRSQLAKNNGLGRKNAGDRR